MGRSVVVFGVGMSANLAPDLTVGLLWKIVFASVKSP